ncbi:hypothetical protein BTVI_140347 [Pitangus sulphuratus]|nr:hypothetical protein BTVI_140347 [Pitangus sulphuratus]
MGVLRITEPMRPHTVFISVLFQGLLDAGEFLNLEKYDFFFFSLWSYYLKATKRPERYMLKNAKQIKSECTLRQFANDIKLRAAVKTLKGRDAVQKDLNRLERQVYAKFMKLNKAKYEVLDLAWGNPEHK